MKIQIISNDENVIESLENLQGEKFEMFSSKNSISGVIDCRELKPDVVIVDSGLESTPDALGIIRRLSKTTNSDFLVIGCYTENNLIKFYNGGATNCIASYNAYLIQAILNSIDKKLENLKSADDVTYGDFKFDYLRRVCKFKGENIKLSPTEFTILNYLIVSLGKVMSRDEIKMEVFQGSIAASSNIVDVHIANIRNKLRDKGIIGVIRSVRSVGYAFNGDKLLEMAKKS